MGGKLLCLGPSGQTLATITRHHVGKALLINGAAYSINASLPEERWDAASGVLQAVVESFSPS